MAAGRPSAAMWRLALRSRRLLGLGTMLAVAAGCADILGVEEVELDGAGGGGGAGSATSTEAVGAGLPTSTSTGDPTTADATSSGSGPICAGPLPACEGTLANAFESAEELLLGWDVDGDDDEEVEIRGGQLELEPDDGDHAAVLSKAPVVVAPPTGACAVWITIPESSSGGSAGIAIGTGDSSGDAVGVERRGDSIVARVGGIDVGSLPVAADARSLRLVFDAAGTVGFEVSTDLVCWDPVVPVQPRPVAGGRVRLFVDGENAKARFDDYCR